MLDSSVTCQMMGLSVHSTTWRVLDVSPGSSKQPIYLSQVQCSSLDSDLMTCVAEDQSSHSCTHAQDVSVRCVRPTWAGRLYITY